MIKEYNRATVVVNDPQEKFEADKEFSAKVRYNKSENTFIVQLPEKKADVPDEDKPKAIEAYKDKNLNITGTITTSDQIKVGVMLKADKAKAQGKGTIREGLENALDAVWEKRFEV